MGSNWREVRLSDAYDFRSGLSKPRTAFGTGFSFLTFKDVFYNTFTPDVLGDLVESSEREREQCSIRRGDVFLTRTSETQDELGMSCVALRDYESATFNGFCKRLRPKDGSIVPEYAAYFFRGPQFRRAVTAMSSMSTRASLNEEMLGRLTVVVPDRFTQASIGGILKSLDDKIELNRRISSTLEQMGRALYKTRFVDIDSELPTKWSRRPLREWADALSGGTPSKANAAFWGGAIPWISPKVMTEIHADEAEAFVTPAAIGNGTRLAPKGSTLVMVRGMGLHQCVRVSQARLDVTFNQDVKALTPREIEPSLLLFAMLDAQVDLLGRVESSGHGTGVLPTDILLSHLIAMPPRDVQREMATPFDLINDRIAVAREQSRTLADLRDLLLPRLLSGELPVRDAELAIEAVA